MITDASDFRPLVPRRLVPVGPRGDLGRPRTRFRADELVEEPDAPMTLEAALVVVQLAARRR